MIPMPPPSYEQTIEAVAACDIPRSGIRVVYEDYLQSDVIKISDLGALTDEKFRCLREAIHPFYLLEIEPEDQRFAYYKVDHRENRRTAQAEAAEWFRSRGLLDAVPLFDPQKTKVDDYLTRVEAFCGYAPGTTLQRFGTDLITIKPEALAFSSSAEQGAKFECLMKTMAAADLEEYGLMFGFLGNEQSSEGAR